MVLASACEMDGQLRRMPLPLVLDMLVVPEDRPCTTPVRQQVPVHRTFIEFKASPSRSSSESPMTPIEPSGKLTAPAALGQTICDAFHRRHRKNRSNSSGSDSEESIEWSVPEAGSAAMPSSCTNKKKLAQLTYCFSPISALAAGFAADTSASPLAAYSDCPSPSMGWSSEDSLMPSSPEYEYFAQLLPMALRLVDATLPAPPCPQTFDKPVPRLLSFEESWADSTTDDEEESDGDDAAADGPCPQYSATAELPSVGSALHGQGLCKRCCFFPKGRCQNGINCQFCHFEHAKHKSKTRANTRRRRTRQRTRVSREAEEERGSPYYVDLNLCEALPVAALRSMGRGGVVVASELTSKAGPLPATMPAACGLPGGRRGATAPGGTEVVELKPACSILAQFAMDGKQGPAQTAEACLRSS
eukprot:TRINITY_DN84477_c0_g1_i1.p1 TRINITY_DN84477_c0_g1~~TRINITY_DN84477_c0_g1_i1.p1  ORF type:complete len:417 (+),score=77.49 TRINITY_DN84477_c0_g1_i1:79-1329(+)